MPNSSYTTWTITLRPNVLFHDGTPCNGAALLTNLQAQAKSVLTGIIINPTLNGITQTGPLSVAISFAKPWVPFPYYLAGGIGGQIAYVVAPSMLANPNGTSHPVGTGPFKFKEWVPNDHFTATANPHYWRPACRTSPQITYRPIPNEESRAEALKSGTINLMITDTPQMIEQFRGNRSYSYIDDSTHVAGEPDMNCIQLNCLAKPFNDATRAPRRCHGHQPPAVRQGHRRQRAAGEQRPVRAGLASTTHRPRTPPTTRRRPRKLVKAAEKQNGGPISFTYGSTNSPAAHPRRGVPRAGLAGGRLQGEPTIVEQNETINNALAGKYQALGWRQFGAVDPDLNYIFWSTTTVSSGVAVDQHGPQLRPDDREPLLQPGAQSTERTSAPAGLQDGEQAPGPGPPLPVDRPGGLGRHRQPEVQNFNNPTHAAGHACVRHDRWLHLADTDLDQLKWRLMSGRILVVEDDERIRSSMRLALEGEGYEVRDAASGEEGLDLFAEAPPDVALIDLMLPGMDGFECCRALRR